MNVVKGEDFVLKLSTKIALHATEHTLNINSNWEKISTVQSPNAKIPLDCDWDATINGLAIVDETITDAMTQQELMEACLNKTVIPVLLHCNITGMLDKDYTGQGIITKYSITSKAGEKATYAVSMESYSGTLEKVTTA